MSNKSEISVFVCIVRQKVEITINHTLQFTRMRRSCSCRDDFFTHQRENYSTLKLALFYDAFTERLWQTLAITSTGSKYGLVHI